MANTIEMKSPKYSRKFPFSADDLISAECPPKFDDDLISAENATISDKFLISAECLPNSENFPISAEFLRFPTIFDNFRQ
jgi:hypothetical protein